MNETAEKCPLCRGVGAREGVIGVSPVFGTQRGIAVCEGCNGSGASRLTAEEVAALEVKMAEAESKLASHVAEMFFGPRDPNAAPPPPPTRWQVFRRRVSEGLYSVRAWIAETILRVPVDRGDW